MFQFNIIRVGQPAEFTLYIGILPTGAIGSLAKIHLSANHKVRVISD